MIAGRTQRMIGGAAGGASVSGVHWLASRDVGMALVMGATFAAVWALTDVLVHRHRRDDTEVP